MREKVKVVVLPETLENTYQMGFEEFEGTDVDPQGFDLAPYQDSARYANNVLPELRSMSGYQDLGYGTYTNAGRVVIVHSPEDRPMDGELTESQYILDEVLESWQNGVYDSVEGNEYGESLE